MKKYLAALLLLASSVYAADNYRIQFTTSGTNGPYQYNLIQGKGGTGISNCFTDISVSATNFPAAGFDLYIFDGFPNGTTVYTLAQSTGALVENWPIEYPLCLSPNTSSFMQIQSSGTYKANISGFQKKFF